MSVKYIDIPAVVMDNLEKNKARTSFQYGRKVVLRGSYDFRYSATTHFGWLSWTAPNGQRHLAMQYLERE